MEHNLSESEFALVEKLRGVSAPMDAFATHPDLMDEFLALAVSRAHAARSIDGAAIKEDAIEPSHLDADTAGKKAAFLARIGASSQAWVRMFTNPAKTKGLRIKLLVFGDVGNDYLLSVTVAGSELEVDVVPESKTVTIATQITDTALDIKTLLEFNAYISTAEYFGGENGTTTLAAITAAQLVPDGWFQGGIG